MGIRHLFIAIYAAVLLPGVVRQAHCQHAAQENKILLRIGTGLYDVRRTSATNFRQIEIGFTHEDDTLQPFAGFMSTTTSDNYEYLGVLGELPLFDRVRLLIRFAGGAFERGKGTDLGFPLEFRSELELTWQWTTETRVGIAFSHLSNGAFSDINPGLEVLSLTYTITE